MQAFARENMQAQFTRFTEQYGPTIRMHALPVRSW